MSALPCSSDGAPGPNVGATHYAECWREHPACAVARVERLEAVLRRVRHAGWSACIDGQTIVCDADTVEAGTAFRTLIDEVRDGGR